MDAAKRPVSVVFAGPYGHPWHPALVPIPLGSWLAAGVFDVLSRTEVSDAASLAIASRWLIGLGILGAFVAGVAGFTDLLAIPPATRAFRVAVTHMSLNLVITAVFIVNLVSRSGHDNVGNWQLVMTWVALAALAVSGFLGGKLAYTYGVRVAREDKQAEGFEP